MTYDDRHQHTFSRDPQEAGYCLTCRRNVEDDLDGPEPEEDPWPADVDPYDLNPVVGPADLEVAA